MERMDVQRKDVGPEITRFDESFIQPVSRQGKMLQVFDVAIDVFKNDFRRSSILKHMLK